MTGESTMSCDCSHTSVNTENERKTLHVALVLNATMFVVGMAAGLWAQSSGLMADALDMLTDATAYGLGLMAVTRGPRFKQYSARWTGVTLMLSPKTRSLQPPESSCDCPISTFTVGKLPAGVGIMSAKVVRIRKSVLRSRGLRNLDSSYGNEYGSCCESKTR
jgi:hypothetical protein